MNNTTTKGKLFIRSGTSNSFALALLIAWAAYILSNNLLIFINSVFLQDFNDYYLSSFISVTVSLVALALGIILLISKKPTIASSVLTFIMIIEPIWDIIQYTHDNYPLAPIEMSIQIALIFVILWSGVISILSVCLKNKRSKFLACWFIPMILLFVTYVVYFVFNIILFCFIYGIELRYLHYAFYSASNTIWFRWDVLVLGIAFAFIAKGANLYNKANSYADSIENKKTADDSFVIDKSETFYVPYNIQPQPVIQNQGYYRPITKNQQEANDIARFKKLLDMGAITPEEYETKKKQILGL